MSMRVPVLSMAESDSMVSIASCAAACSSGEVVAVHAFCKRSAAHTNSDMSDDWFGAHTCTRSLRLHHDHG